MKIFHFIEECYEELRKVVWPTVDDLKESAKVVVVSVFIMTMIIWGYDFLYLAAVKHFMN